MIRYLLDTDHLTLHERGHEPLRVRLASVPPEAIGVSAVTVEEILRGRLGVLSRRLEGAAMVRGYAKLIETVQFFHRISVVPFDDETEQQFQQLRSARLRVGTQDLKIAATALAHRLIVVTRNRRDFERVPGLTIDDWSVEKKAPESGTDGAPDSGSA
jgi:tRNA(fMet)-specific endonuclease VapC